MRRVILLVVVLLLAPAAVRPAAPPPIPVLEKWTVDDVVASEWAADFRISPDGQFALWVKLVPDKDKNEDSKTQLWLIDPTAGPATR